VLTLALGQRLSRRLQELERRTRLIAGGDFSPMPLPQRQDEIRDLTVSVNDMAARLAQLQETVKTTERLRLLGQVSGGLAHQLRNGLTGARLTVQLYLRECPAGADTSALEVALRQLTLLETSVKRLLELGRAEPGPRQRCDLRALLEETARLIEPQCRHAGIALLQPPPGQYPVEADPEQLGQLLLNVLTNAIEAAGPGGTVELRLSCQKGPPPELPPVPDVHPWVVLEVIDSGPGPPAEIAERLFEPFVTSKREGVGLGLAVAQQVARLHGGWIGWSRDGGRTCFRILLPQAGERASQSSATDA
jgi:signal transduction histidine kinase